MNHKLRAGTWIDNPKLLACLENGSALPMPGPAASQLISMLNNTSITPAELGDAVGRQPLLAERAVALINHPLRHSRRKAHNLRQVISQLGTRGVANLALTLALERDFSATPGICLDRQAFWVSARSHALSAWVLATAAKLPVAEESMLCGLLQDIGLLALDLALPEFYPEFAEGTLMSPTELQALEEGLVSVPHNLLGAWLAKHWGLGLRIQQAIANSHEDIATDSDQATLSATVQLSTLLASLAAEPANTVRSRRLAAESKRCLGLDPAEVARMYRMAASFLTQACQAFDEGAKIDPPVAGVISIGNPDNTVSSALRCDERTHQVCYRTLPDRVATGLALEREFQAALEHGWPLSVVLLQTRSSTISSDRSPLDLAVRTLSRTLRPSDIMGQHEDDTLLIVMPGTGRDHASAAGRRLTQNLGDIAIEGLGIATSSPDAAVDTWESLMIMAERALSSARRVGSGICSAG